MRVLVVEDHDKVAGLLRRGLEEAGFAVDLATNGSDALWLATEEDYDAILLDVGLGDIDGFEVCARLRAGERWAPVLMLTARDAVEDRVRGLDIGADDYLVKPFEFPELLAPASRVATARNTRETRDARVGDLMLDPATHRVERAGTSIDLTATEFTILEQLMRQPGVVIARQELLRHNWDFAFDGDPHVVTVYIGSLRDKIDRPFARVSIETVRGAGYRIVDDRAV